MKKSLCDCVFIVKDFVPLSTGVAAARAAASRATVLRGLAACVCSICAQGWTCRGAEEAKGGEDERRLPPVASCVSPSDGTAMASAPSIAHGQYSMAKNAVRQSKPETCILWIKCLWYTFLLSENGFNSHGGEGEADATSKVASLFSQFLTD